MNRQGIKRVAAGAGLLLAVYLTALALLFPAELGWRIAESQLEARLDLPAAITVTTVSGRVWNGQADGVSVDGKPFGSIRWRLMPSALLRGRLGVSLRWHSEGDHLVARVRLGTGSAEAIAVRGELGAEHIQAWLDLPLLLDGRITLDVPRVLWSADSGFDDASGGLLWAGAGAGLPRPMSLGDYRAELANADGELLAQLTSGPDSALAAEGTAAWRPDGAYRIDLVVRAEGHSDRNLQSVLDSIAQRQRDGSHRLQVHGR